MKLLIPRHPNTLLALSWLVMVLLSVLVIPSAQAKPHYVWQTWPPSGCTGDAVLQGLCNHPFQKVEDIAAAIFAKEAEFTEDNTYTFSYSYVSYQATGDVTGGPPTAPNQSVSLSVTYTILFKNKNDGTSFLTTQHTSNLGAVSFPSPPYYSRAQVLPRHDNGLCCKNPGKVLLPDPINPATGNVTSAEQDFTASDSLTSMAFSRYYNSTDSTQQGLGAGWRGSYSRSVHVNTGIATYLPLDTNAFNSSLYNDEASACISGFAQIKSQVPNWTSATASFSGGVCAISQDGVSLGALPIYQAYDFPIDAEPSPPSFDVIRDDGQAIRFSVINGVITAPPGSSLKLQQTGSGYALIDANDSVETYGTSGRLLTMTSRSGVVQTMSYDGSNRLIGVTDNFGHQLTLSYDAQNRLISVTRQ